MKELTYKEYLLSLSRVLAKMDDECPKVLHLASKTFPEVTIDITTHEVFLCIVLEKTAPLFSECPIELYHSQAMALEEIAVSLFYIENGGTPLDYTEYADKLTEAISKMVPHAGSPIMDSKLIQVLRLNEKCDMSSRIGLRSKWLELLAKKEK